MVIVFNACWFWIGALKTVIDDGFLLEDEIRFFFFLNEVDRMFETNEREGGMRKSEFIWSSTCDWTSFFFLETE